ncbi:MAG: signal peptidase I [Rhodoferax sp.]|jgi:signal peptidase I|nr:signal peptidase I [Rhodoferax sp.]MBP9929317.1 signal peptidase I [Rhodoferax sp.]HQZ04924.1 signal peptidase I [Burkholderiaceae bacterium]
MQLLTTLILGAFVAYAGAWYTGRIDGNFALLLFMAVLVTGIYWLGEKFYFWPRRRRAALELQAHAERRRAELLQKGVGAVDGEGDIEVARAQLLAQPWWLDWTAGLFPVILAVFLLRSFLVEPFKIPSGSMIPTLLVGDLILVNKFHYGLRLPVINTKITNGTPPKRGDVMVFRYPPQPSLDYIKRVVGVPGDEVSYLNKRLAINGVAVENRQVEDFFDEDSMRYLKQFEEKLGTEPHRLLINDDRPAFIPGASEFPNRDNCRYSVEGVVCKVPPGHYFMMGDNRDNSLDSRYWGFVPDQNIVGRAFFVWMNFSSLSRIGPFH